MGVNLAQKNISTFNMLCSETAQITLTLTASKDITANPVDIMLVLDHSGSMADPTSPLPGAPTKIQALKDAATIFTQIIANASTNTTPPANSPTIANSKIGVVSFANTATNDLALNQTVATINTAITSLSANGSTNHAAAFTTAQTSLQTGTNPRKVLVMLTDGLSTVPQPDPVAAADSAAEAVRNDGTIIYCIGLGADVNETNLIKWAGSAARVIMAPDASDLQTAFEALAANLINPAPENITVVDTLEDNFEIVDPIIPLAPAGITVNTVVSANKKTITWTLSSLGLTEPEVASLSFGIQYTGTTNGIYPFNKTITYNDTTTPNPSSVKFATNGTTISVICDDIVYPNCDYACKSVDVPCCGGVVDVVMPNSTSAYDILCDGTILNVITRFKNICPNRQLAIGVIACETISGVEQSPVYRITTIDTPKSSTVCDCQDFAVPLEVLLPPPSTGSSCTTQRQVKVRVIAHYVANTFAPCRKCF